MPTPFGHILICRTDNIGDVVLTLPLAGFLKSRYPGIRIDMLVRAYAAPVVRHCRFVDSVIEYDPAGDPAAAIGHARYDTILFAFPNRRLAMAARRARIPNRVGTSHRLYHWLTCNKLAHFSRVKSALHEAQLNFALLRPLGIDHVPSLAEIPALYGLSAPARSGTGGCNFILHPKSNGNGREWPLAHYTELARQLSAYPDITLWVTGSAAEGALLADQAPELLAMPNVRNLCGSMDLEGLLALIGSSDGLVASGTGPLHMSAALGRPTLGLFPPLKPIDPARWGALGKRARVLCVERPCGNCTDPQACTCMLAITPGQVAEVLLEWKNNGK
ncbi:MAG: glycosyltransferase family 9 protein [Pseudomonadota bacterium]|nr:glycosyltransferase family 9 protein [Pseudomonadota bacterium]